jgi:hypothetical protein
MILARRVVHSVLAVVTAGAACMALDASDGFAECRMFGVRSVWRILQQLRDYPCPFRVQCVRCHVLTRLPIPIRRISGIAFLAMQIGVHPRGSSARDVLRDRVRLIPVTAGIVPHRLQQRRDLRRVRVGECGAELLQGHRIILADFRRRLLRAERFNLTGRRATARCGTPTWWRCCPANEGT